MKRYLLLTLMIAGLMIPSLMSAQVFGTGQTLNRGRASLGIEPVFYNSGWQNDLSLFFHGGYGLKRGLDLGIKLGVLGDQTYFGADFEWAMSSPSPYLSVSLGAHTYRDIGLDATLNLTFLLTNEVEFFTGLDLDVESTEPTIIPLWLPLGLEIDFRRNVDILFEVGLGLNDDAYDFMGGGLNFYF